MVERLPERRRNSLIFPRLGLVVLLLMVSTSCRESESDRDSAKGASAASSGGDRSLVPMRDDSDRQTAIRLIVSGTDPRMQPLLTAAETWKRAAGPDRKVIDQVVLVPDLPTYLEVIGQWSDRAYFPVLFDEPAWSLPFIRAFRPARVLRLSTGVKAPEAEVPSPPLKGDEALWTASMRAVGRSWTVEDQTAAKQEDASRPPQGLGATPPGLVFSNPQSPMLAGAVALAAGRFQPLLRLAAVPAASQPDAPRAGPANRTFHDILSLSEARGLTRLIQLRARNAVGDVNELGDACDFLTLALDWPYRYRNDAEYGIVRGEQALDDLIGRILETDEGGLETSRTRWAFTGRLLGDAAASTYRAMCSLFLPPENSLLWNTYSHDGNWGIFQMTEAARILGVLSPSVRPVHRVGADATLAQWHQVFDPVNRFSWIMLNSSGSPRQFSISGGKGRPADLPRGRPTAVAMIHSFSAADPLDPSTIAGRWLENGAFVYHGAMNEPYLHAFHPPCLTAELAARGIPLGAALREIPEEPLGRPWRTVYLGDPLYRFRAIDDDAPSPRLDPADVPEANLPESLTIRDAVSAGSHSLEAGAQGPDRLNACLLAAMSGLCHAEGAEASAPWSLKNRERPAWLEAAASIDRRALDPVEHHRLDELMIDGWLHADDPDRLLDWLLRIPPEDCSPRTARTIESLSVSCLARLSHQRSVTAAMALWERVMIRHWPANSEFPAQLTERLAAIVDDDPYRYRAPYREHLARIADTLPSDPAHAPILDLINHELKRLEASK